jgi:hypothetical protein
MVERKYHKLKGLSHIIIDEYVRGETSETLALKYECDPSAILYILKKNNIPRHSFSKLFRKNDYNESFFDKIDSEEKAYFLGFLYADGYNNEERYQIHLTLREEDKSILEYFKDKIYTNSDKTLAYYKPKKESHKSTVRLLICNEYISKQLAKFGVIQKKSLVLKFPTEDVVPSYLQNHFIRGYFDGDGCIFHSVVDPCAIISFTGTENMCNKIKQIISENVTIYTPKTSKKGTVYSVQYHSKFGIEGMFNYLYNESTVYLTRKKEKFESFIKTCHEQIV